MISVSTGSLISLPERQTTRKDVGFLGGCSHFLLKFSIVPVARICPGAGTLQLSVRWSLRSSPAPWNRDLAALRDVPRVTQAVRTSTMLAQHGYTIAHPGVLGKGPLGCSPRLCPRGMEATENPQRQGAAGEKAQPSAENFLQRGTSHCQINILIISQHENAVSQRRARRWHICSLRSAVTSRDSGVPLSVTACAVQDVILALQSPLSYASPKKKKKRSVLASL